ncbi:MAG: fibrillarin-like rRNA/tRNA 2'-O-methyltransferase [Candidatus Micrarchaeaceae archaeon]
MRQVQEKLKQVFEGVYEINGKLATLNLSPGSKVYNEELISIDGVEYRTWNPYRSKLAAAILKGLKNFKIKSNSNVLYLGAATGTTSSHVSDIAKNGSVFCVEISQRNMRELIKVCEIRSNMLPILADANNVAIYNSIIKECDIIYQDVATPNQADILEKNSIMLKKGGYAYFIIKSQSIDISKKPEEVFDMQLGKLKGFKVLEKIDLEPYDSMHLFAVLKKV